MTVRFEDREERYRKAVDGLCAEAWGVVMDECSTPAEGNPRAIGRHEAELLLRRIRRQIAQIDQTIGRMKLPEKRKGQSAQIFDFDAYRQAHLMKLMGIEG